MFAFFSHSSSRIPLLDFSFLPAAFLERLHKQMGSVDLNLTLQGMTDARDTCFRVNTLLAQSNKVLDQLNQEGWKYTRIDQIPGGYRLPASLRSALLASEYIRNKKIYIQNASSMVPPLVLAPKPGERVLDLTAAPGSKTLQLAALMQGKGELAAVEIVKNRFYRLKRNLKEHGAGWVRTFHQDGRKVWRYRPEYFDRILLDAPCSSEGRFHVSDPKSMAFWKPRKVKEMVRKQRQLLYSAVHALKPGGSLVYSTCSLSPAENESIIADAMSTFGEILQLDPVVLELPVSRPGITEWEDTLYPDTIVHTLRILPGPYTEGFFIARLRKIASSHPPAQ